MDTLELSTAPDELPDIAAYAYQDVHVWSALRPASPPSPPPVDPPLEISGQNFLWAFGRSKIFSGANCFRPKIFFGAFGASKNSASLRRGGGWTPPPQKKPRPSPE